MATIVIAIATDMDFEHASFYGAYPSIPDAKAKIKQQLKAFTYMNYKVRWRETLLGEQTGGFSNRWIRGQVGEVTTTTPQYGPFMILLGEYEVQN